MAGYVVVLDANILYGIEATDFFATMATRRLFRPHWSPQILDGVVRNLASRPDLDRPPPSAGLRDTPAALLDPLGVEAVSADLFALAQVDLDVGGVLGSLDAMSVRRHPDGSVGRGGIRGKRYPPRTAVGKAWGNRAVLNRRSVGRLAERRREHSTTSQNACAPERSDMLVEQRLEDMNVVLPGNLHRPAGIESPFQWAAIHGGRASVSGHEPLVTDGRPASRLGGVPTEISLEHAQSSARMAAVEMLASLRSVLGDLDRVVSWLTVVSFLNADPNYTSIDLVMNPVSDLILALYGPEVGRHERKAVAVSATPLNLPITIVAEVEIRN